MSVTDISSRIHHTIQGHAPPFKEDYLLLIHPRNPMVMIGQAYERYIFIHPKPVKRCHIVRTHGEDFHITAFESSVIIPQARQLRAAVGSHETAQKVEHNDPAAIIGQTNPPAVNIVQFKFGGRLSRRDQFLH